MVSHYCSNLTRRASTLNLSKDAHCLAPRSPATRCVNNNAHHQTPNAHDGVLHRLHALRNQNTRRPTHQRHLNTTPSNSRPPGPNSTTTRTPKPLPQHNLPPPPNPPLAPPSPTQHPRHPTTSPTHRHVRASPLARFPQRLHLRVVARSSWSGSADCDGGVEFSLGRQYAVYCCECCAGSIHP